MASTMERETTAAHGTTAHDTTAHGVARPDWARLAPAALRAQYGVEEYARSSGLEHPLLELVKLSASYLNGCAYCVDMHTKDARAAGETEQRLYAVPVWRETPYYTARERSALAWTEAVTRLAPDGVPDALYDATRADFTDLELVNLTMAVVASNGWNRLAIALRQPVGSYVPPARTAAR